MTMTLREVQHLSMKARPYRRECRGHDPAKKRICCTDAACSVGKVYRYTLLTTVCSTSDMREIKGTGKKTQILEFKSLESSDSEQHNGEVRETRRRWAGQGSQDKRHAPEE